GGAAGRARRRGPPADPAAPAHRALRSQGVAVRAQCVSPMSRSRVSDAARTETIVTSAIATRYAARAPRPYGRSAVAMNGDTPPETTDASCEPSDAPL